MDANDTSTSTDTRCVNRIYVRGISKKASRDTILQHFAQAGAVEELIWAGADNPQLKGVCRVIYASPNDAAAAVQLLNGKPLHGVNLSVRLDLGAAAWTAIRESSNKFITVQRAIRPVEDEAVGATHLPAKRDRMENTSISTSEPASEDSKVTNRELKKQRRQEQNAAGATFNGNNAAPNSSAPPIVRYNSDGLVVNGILYPTSRGLYLMKLLQLVTRHCASAENSDTSAPLTATASSYLNRESLLPMISLLVSQKFGNSQAKEITESMAMVTALWRLFEYISVTAHLEVNKVTVFVLGDGKLPFTALMLMLYMPLTWQFVSIDPIMDFDASGLPAAIRDRLVVAKCMSQEFDLAAHIKSQPDNPSPDRRTYTRIIDVIVGCHSHAPLTEFWHRIKSIRSSTSASTPAAESSPLYDASEPTIVYYRMCASLPCCGKDWSLIKDTCPVEEYEDYEVLSSRRRVFLYSEKYFS
jgi:hypothetical protein